MATLKDIAEKANVSLMTVSNAINGNAHKMNQETYKKIMAIIEELNYVPSASARSLTLKKSNIIGLWMPSDGEISLLDLPYNSYIAGAIEKPVNNHGYSLMFLSTPSVKTFINQLISWEIDGCIGVGVTPEDAKYISENFDKPFVFIDSYFDLPQTLSIRTDDYQGGYLATQYLLKRGHRHIGIVSGDEVFDMERLKANGVLYNRYLGYIDAMREYQGTSIHLLGNKIDYNSGLAIGKEIGQQQEMTAFFCTADILAAGVIEGIKRAGKIVPDDYSIIGYDDLPISSYISPKLTTIRQDNSQKGKKAVDMLLSSIDKEKNDSTNNILEVEIVERETVQSMQN